MVKNIFQQLRTASMLLKLSIDYFSTREHDVSIMKRKIIRSDEKIPDRVNFIPWKVGKIWYGTHVLLSSEMSSVGLILFSHGLDKGTTKSHRVEALYSD